MNILYLTYDGLTDPLGQSQILPYLTALSHRGYTFTIVSCEKKDRLLKEGELIKDMLNKAGISWIPVHYSNKIPVISAIFTLRRLMKAAFKAATTRPYAVVHCRSTLPALAGLILKKRSAIKLLFDMRGFWADERVEGNIWPQSNLLYRMLYNYTRRREKQLIQTSDHIISLTQAAKDLLQKETSMPITVIPCCADFAHFDPGKISKDAIDKRKKELEINESSKILAYTGSIGTWYMLDEMLDFFIAFLQKHPEAIFLFITKEDPRLILQRAELKKITPKSLRIISAGRSEMPLLLSLADASLYFIRKGHSKMASSPVKQGESLAMGIPVITNDGIGDNNSIIGGQQFGWLVNDFSEDSYNLVIDELSRMNPQPAFIRNKAKELLSLDKGAELYFTVYSEMTVQ